MTSQITWLNAAVAINTYTCNIESDYLGSVCDQQSSKKGKNQNITHNACATQYYIALNISHDLRSGNAFVLNTWYNTFI